MSPEERARRTRQAKRSRILRELGRPIRVDAAPATRHVRALVAAGATRSAIARIAGLSPNVICWLANGTQTTICRDNADRILAITLADIIARPDDGLVPATGTQRRIRALLVLGWSHEHITKAMRAAGPVRMRSALLLRDGHPWVMRSIHDAVVAVYADLSGRPGPNPETARRARRMRYPGPLAWEGVDIDDPAAHPIDDQATQTTASDRLDDWTFLVNAGIDRHQAARRAGYAELDNVRTAARRAGRHDVITLLDRTTARSTAAA